ncbi:MAG: hypothetical protein KatS3mg111_0231 [Pirellulaceae bacterium]|nr:MAG: hypothetical protein KatS3mg111_0231 [Pirellulaceae bacterium]
MWIQREISLRPRPRGFHLVTSEIVGQLPELSTVERGLLHLFIMHTSASLTINENADPDVRADMETFCNHLVPERGIPIEHTIEGPDDMPAHVKTSLMGSSVTIPITAGRLRLGTWQGIYLGEHRNRGGVRRLVATIHGEPTT